MTTLKFLFLIFTFIANPILAQSIDYSQLRQCYASLHVQTPNVQTLNSISSANFLEWNILGNTKVEPNALIIQRVNSTDRNKIDIIVIQQNQSSSFPLSLISSRRRGSTAKVYTFPRSSLTRSRCSETSPSLNLPIEVQCPNRSTCPQVMLQVGSENKTVRGESVSSPCSPKLTRGSTQLASQAITDSLEIENLAKKAITDQINYLHNNFDLIIEKIKKDHPQNPDIFINDFKKNLLASIRTSDPRGSCQKIFTENDGLYESSQNLMCELLEPQSYDCQSLNQPVNSTNGGTSPSEQKP